MKIKIPCNEANLTAKNSYQIEAELHCNLEDITTNMSYDEKSKLHENLLDDFGCGYSAGHFGNEILKYFKVDDILEIFDIESIIKTVGRENFKNYLREIYIDKVIDSSTDSSS